MEKCHVENLNFFELLVAVVDDDDDDEEEEEEEEDDFVHQQSVSNTSKPQSPNHPTLRTDPSKVAHESSTILMPIGSTGRLYTYPHERLIFWANVHSLKLT